jgi:Divergent AAA domain.
MIGVDDSCKVYGISCTRKQEDIARCQIDNTIKQFQPHVSTHMYMVEFIPVRLLANDVEFDCVDPLLKVLEVSVVRQNLMTTNLYTTDKENVYLRRDGSVEGPLKVSQIIEWCRAHFTNDFTNANYNKKIHQAQQAIGGDGHMECSCDRTKIHKKESIDNSLSEKLEEITDQQNLLLRQLEESLVTGHAELRQQVKLLQSIIDKKDEQLREMIEKHGSARNELQRFQKDAQQAHVITCTIL